MSDRDLTQLPASIQDAARVLGNGEVMWCLADAEDAIKALAEANRIVLGLDIRDYQEDGSFVEVAWSGFEPHGADDVSRGCRAALDSLRSRPVPGDWVLVTWR